MRYLRTSQALDARFPAFATEIHGIHVQPDGTYRAPCQQAVGLAELVTDETAGRELATV